MLATFTETDQFYLDMLSTSGLSASSKKTYISGLKFFQSPRNPRNVAIKNLLRKPTLYVPDPDKESVHAQLNRINAILKILRLMGLDLAECAKTGWIKRQETLFAVVRESVENNIPSVKQKQSMLVWDDVVAAPKGCTLGSDEHLLLTLYIAFTRRQADYWKVALYNGKNGPVDTDHSFIHLGIKKPYMYLVEFKTVAKYGAFRAELPAELHASLRASLTLKPRKYLFCRDRDREPFPDKNYYQKWSNQMLQRIFKNKHVTVGTLRHSHATHINSLSNVTYMERKTLANAMAHSVDMQLRYMKLYD